MKMSGPLAIKRTIRRSAFFRGPKSLKTFLYDGRIFPVVVRVHLYIRCAYVHFVTRALQHERSAGFNTFLRELLSPLKCKKIPYLNAVIMRLLSVMTTSLVSVRTVVTRRVPHETVLQALVPLFMPLEVSDHFFFLHKHSRVAVKTVEMLSENTTEYDFHTITIHTPQRV